MGKRRGQSKDKLSKDQTNKQLSQHIKQKLSPAEFIRNHFPKMSRKQKVLGGMLLFGLVCTGCDALNTSYAANREYKESISDTMLEDMPENIIPHGNLKLDNDALVIMVDYGNTKCAGTEEYYHDLVFGEMNNYFEEVTGQLSYKPANEDCGEKDGVVRVNLDREFEGLSNDDRSMYDFVHGDIREAIKQASCYFDFSQYGKSKITSDDLTLIFVVANTKDGGNGELEYYDLREFAGWFEQGVYEDGVELYKSDPEEQKCGFVVLKDLTPITVMENDAETSQLILEYLGPLAHEVGHTKGTEDEYDETGMTNPVDVLSLGDGGGGVIDLSKSMLQVGRPSQYDAFNLMKMGALKPKVIDVSKIEDEQLFTLHSLGSKKGDFNALVITNGENYDEFFIAYNMQLDGVNKAVRNYLSPKAEGGIVIEHCCAKGNNDSSINNGVKRVEVEEPNEGELGYSPFDQGDIEKQDPFYTAKSKSKFGTDTYPNSNFYGDGNEQKARTGIVVEVLSKSGPDMKIRVSKAE